MQEREILEVEQGTSSSENIDGVYTLSITGEDLEAAIEQVEENKTNIKTLQENFSEQGYVTKEFATVNSAITGINSSLTQVNTRLADVEEEVAKENEFADRVGDLETRLNDLNETSTTLESFYVNTVTGIADVEEQLDRLNNIQLISVQDDLTIENAFTYLGGKIDALEEDVYGLINPITNEREDGIKDKLTSVRDTVYGLSTGNGSDGLVAKVSNIEGRLNEFNKTKNTLETEFENLRIDVDEKPWESYTDEVIEPLANSITTLTTRVQNLEPKTLVDGYQIPAAKDGTPGVIMTTTKRIEHVIGYKFVFTIVNTTTTEELYIPYEGIEYFTESKNIGSNSATPAKLQITKQWVCIEEANGKNEVYASPQFYFVNTSSMPINVTITTYYSHTNGEANSYYN